MRPDLPTGTVTFLFTDVEGSTRLLHELGAENYAEALAEHRRLIREACMAEGGVEVDTQGDAFFFAFPTAPGALAAAAAFSDTLTSGPIRVRVGVHTGTPLVTDEGYVGDDVHFAARVAATSHGGQVVLSQATAVLVDGTLTDLGEHRLKDITEAVAIYQLGDVSFPPLKTISNTNLPRPASSFLGREAELQQVLSRIEDGARLVTLTGPGGTGKTRLAIEAASTLVPQFKAGVFWIGLASLRDPELVTETIAQTLGAKEGLAEHVGERELLLLLDNLEQVIDAAPALGELLSACPNLTLLVTSRELLRIQGEVEYPVPPLATQEAIVLFCTRAQLEPSEEIAELCARLDSLPLAVELAAARTQALTPAQILERISGRLDLLKGGRDADPRQQTLRATIEWSYDLLAPEEQELFARLSVFAGGCTLEAAEEICAADVDTLQSLAEKSLLRFTDGRYWMLETIREYAEEQLAATTQVDELRRAHVGYLVSSLRSILGEAQSPRPAELHRLEAERPNLRAALTWGIESVPAEQAYVLGIGYALLCRMRGPVSEGRRWLDSVRRLSGDVPHDLRLRALRTSASLAELQRDHGSAIAFAEDALELARVGGVADDIATALLALGVSHGTAANFERADELEREALVIFAATGNERQERQTLGLLAWIAIARGDYREAQGLCETALRMSREAGDDRGVVLALGNLGHALARQGNLDEAVRLQYEALGVSRDHLDFSGVADGLIEIASLAVASRRYEEAAVMLGASTALREEAEVALDLVAEDMYVEALNVLQAELGSGALASAIARGRLMPFDQAVEYALTSID